jgi:hypothetical protein
MVFERLTHQDISVLVDAIKDADPEITLQGIEFWDVYLVREATTDIA